MLSKQVKGGERVCKKVDDSRQVEVSAAKRRLAWKAPWQPLRTSIADSLPYRSPSTTLVAIRLYDYLAN